MKRIAFLLLLLGCESEKPPVAVDISLCKYYSQVSMIIHDDADTITGFGFDTEEGWQTFTLPKPLEVKKGDCVILDKETLEMRVVAPDSPECGWVCGPPLKMMKKDGAPV